MNRVQKLRTWSCCCCLLLCSILLFAGCSTTSQYSVYYLDGSRSTEFQIKVDELACQNAGINATLVMYKIIQYANQQEEYLRTNGQTTEGVTIKHGTSSTDNFEYNFGIYFDTFGDYCRFFGITQDDIDNSEPEIVSGLFVSQYIVQRTELTDEAGNLVTSSLGVYIPYQTIYTDFRLNLCGGDTAKCNELMQSITLGIVRCFPHEYGYRANASESGTILMPKGVNSTEKVAYSAFFWQGTLLNPPAELVVYKNYITYQNRVAWYTLAIVLTIVFGLILTLILCCKNKNAQASANGNGDSGETPASADDNFDVCSVKTTDTNTIIIKIKRNKPTDDKQD